MTYFPETPDELLVAGLNNRWYSICPFRVTTDRPVSRRRLRQNFVVSRSVDGKPYPLDDDCPRRGAPLSLGTPMRDRIACGYNGVQLAKDGVIGSVPGKPGCGLEGKKAPRAFNLNESTGVIFRNNAIENIDSAPRLNVPEQRTDHETYPSFLCNTEWKGDHRCVIDNVAQAVALDGRRLDRYGVRRARRAHWPFIFEKNGQRNMDFDWTEWAETRIHYMRPEIPYPKSGGPGGSFGVIGIFTAITGSLAAVFHWRARRVQRWQRNACRFLYQNRIEAGHWAMLEQGQIMLEKMESDAKDRESLCLHDIDIVRLRRRMRKLALVQPERLGGTA